MFEIEGLEDAAVAAALVTGPGHRLVQHNGAFRELFGFWRPGQEAGVALSGPRLRPVLRALDLAGTERSSPLVDAAGNAGDGSYGHRWWVVNCVPVVSRHGASVLLLGARVPEGPAAAADARPRGTAEREADLARYEALLSAVPQVVWRMDRDGEVSALVGRLGEAAGGLWHPGGGLSWRDAVHPKDRAAFGARWAATARGEAPLDTVVRVRRAGEPVRYRHVQIVAVPVLDGGEVCEWVGTVTDAEDQWRVRTRDRLLERASAVASARDLQEAFAATAAAVVPDLVDAFVVFQLRRPGRHQDPGAGRDVLYATRGRRALAPGVPPLPPLTDDFALGAMSRKVIAEGRTKLLAFPPGQPPKDLVSGPSADWLTEARATSLAIVPIVIDDRTVALASAATCCDNPPPAESELGMLEEVLRSVQDPLRRTLELQSVRDTALVLQRSFLITPPRVAGAELAAVYEPASTTAEIGGDWYDAVALPDGTVTLSIGDVAGHDLAAATEMTKASSMLRAFAYSDGAAGPARALSRLDHVTQGVSTAALITALHAVLRPVRAGRWDVTLSNAGHPPPLLVPAAGPPRYLHGRLGPDPPLCVAPDVERTDFRHGLGPGDTLLFYTDGLVETPGTDISAGMRLLAERATGLRRTDRSLADLVTALLPPAGGVEDAEDAGDDIALIAFRVAEPPPQP
ncbi:SpoIIE family protein phosphatase [Streptomyces sp. NPDC047002]|uniref:SpoIIE family protein phosphatase n=1 Tax=Streptomyces sp. NPDC047002 TaxID=3155475 RepID=UPI003454F2F9